MKEITKDVILDLLPLYLAGEVSEETAALVKKHLETDPELAETAKEMAKADSLNKVPIPFRKETAMETYQEAKKWMTIRLLGFAALGTVMFICTMFILFAYLISGR
ncbi:MAG: zf-HC2 domain-containing protein [Chloroflexi bacterium]|nr:zf-HC2 domain-containing protein [Chloroflexota bacterium]